jgi:hypothetical protein
MPVKAQFLGADDQGLPDAWTGSWGRDGSNSIALDQSTVNLNAASSMWGNEGRVVNDLGFAQI